IVRRPSREQSVRLGKYKVRLRPSSKTHRLLSGHAEAPILRRGPDLLVLLPTSTFQRSAMVRLAGSFINHKFSLDNYHLQLYSYCPFGHTLAKSAVFPSRKPGAKPTERPVVSHSRAWRSVRNGWCVLSWCSSLMVFLSRVTTVQCFEDI